MSVDLGEMRTCLGHFASGVTIVSFYLPESAGRVAHGLTVSAFSSLSLDPPLVLVCIDKLGGSHEALSSASHFAVNILSSTQESAAGNFANPRFDSADRFQGLAMADDDDAPVLTDNLADLVCTPEQVVDGGDHSIFVGRVLRAQTHTGREPLVYFNRAFRSLVPRKD